MPADIHYLCHVEHSTFVSFTSEDIFEDDADRQVERHEQVLMKRRIILAYGILAYSAFLSAILYLIGFVDRIVVPKNIDSGTATSTPEAIIVDLSLIALFGISHSVMARPAFKNQLTRIIPQAAERSNFVMVASLTLMLLYWQWRPISFVLWSCDPPLAWLLFGGSMFGWLMVCWSTFLIDHFELFGLRQAWLNYRGLASAPPLFVVRGLYKHVRHPIMLSFLIAFWLTPTMTVGHLLFAVSMTCYIFIGIAREERDLMKALGERYLRYREDTPMIWPRGKWK